MCVSQEGGTGIGRDGTGLTERMPRGGAPDGTPGGPLGKVLLLVGRGGIPRGGGRACITPGGAKFVDGGGMCGRTIIGRGGIMWGGGGRP